MRIVYSLCIGENLHIWRLMMMIILMHLHIYLIALLCVRLAFIHPVGKVIWHFLSYYRRSNCKWQKDKNKKTKPTHTQIQVTAIIFHITFIYRCCTIHSPLIKFVHNFGIRKNQLFCFVTLFVYVLCAWFLFSLLFLFSLSLSHCIGHWEWNRVLMHFSWHSNSINALYLIDCSFFFHNFFVGNEKVCF